MVMDSIEHGGFSAHDNIAVQVFANIHIALHNSRKGELVNPFLFQANQAGPKHNLWASEALIANGNRQPHTPVYP